MLIDSVTSQAIFDQLETSASARGVSTASCPQSGKLDVLVRTSNVKRLSDFMMWQVGAWARCSSPQSNKDTQLHFVKTYWPEFGLTDMLPILLGWQQKAWLRSVGW